MNELLLEINKLLGLVETKGISSSYEFADFRVTLVLTNAKLELSTTKELSDASFGAIVTLAGCSYQNYFGLYDEIHESISLVHKMIYPFNRNPNKADIPSPSCQNKKEWFEYYNHAIQALKSGI